MPSLFGTSTNTNQAQSGSSNVNTNASSTPTFSPGLTNLMNSLMGYSTTSMTNPSAQLAPIQSAGLDQINQQYATVPQTVTTQLASRGYGSSGLEGNSLTQVANAKAGSMSAFNGQLASDAVQQSQFGANLANQLLNTAKGTTSTGTSSGTTSSNGSSSSTTSPGIGNILSGLGGLASLLMLGGGGGGLSGGDLTGYQSNGSGIYTGTPTNPITFPGEPGQVPITT